MHVGVHVCIIIEVHAYRGTCMHVGVHGFQPYAHLWWVLECVPVLYACVSTLCSHAVVHTHTQASPVAMAFTFCGKGKGKGKGEWVEGDKECGWCYVVS